MIRTATAPGLPANINPTGIAARALAARNGSGARLPQSYEAAKNALSNCASIDECQDWADKAAALASYAKQANDDELMKMAVRIRDRAIRRAGELLKQIDGRGGDRSKTEGDHGSAITQRQAAANAGLSEHQQLQAVRVANVPADDFENQVESQNPPTITKLAEQGKKTAPPPKPVLDLQGRDPDEFNSAMHYVGGWEDAAKDLAALKHEQALPILTPSEIARLRASIKSIDAVTDRIITRI